MMLPQDQHNELQRIWQKACKEPECDEHLMMIKLLQEKHRSFRDFVRGEDYAGYMIILVFAPLTAFAAWIAHPMLFMQLGYSIWTIMFVAGAAVTCIADRRLRLRGTVDLSVCAYQRELQKLYEGRIRFSKSIKYWFALPFILGLVLVLFPIVRRFMSGYWSILLIVVLMVFFWLSVWYMYDIRRVNPLQERKDEIDELLNHMDRA